MIDGFVGGLLIGAALSAVLMCTAFVLCASVVGRQRPPLPPLPDWQGRTAEDLQRERACYRGLLEPRKDTERHGITEFAKNPDFTSH